MRRAELLLVDDEAPVRHSCRRYSKAQVIGSFKPRRGKKPSVAFRNVRRSGHYRYLMPDMDGLELTKVLHHNFRHQNRRHLR